MLSDKAEYQEAEELYFQVLEINKRDLGLRHADTITTMQNIGLLFEKKEIMKIQNYIINKHWNVLEIV